MEIQKLRYLFGDVFKICLITTLVGVVIFGVYAFVTRDNDIYGKLPKPYFQNSLTREVVWDASAVSLDTPAQEVVFKVKNRKISREQSWGLAGKLGLPRGGTIELDKNKDEHYYTKNATSELSINLTDGSVHYKNSGVTASTLATSTINKTQAAAEAKKFVAGLGINTKTYDLKQPKYEFLQRTPGSNHLSEVKENKANIVYVSFNRKIDGVDVVTVGGFDSLSIGLNNQNQVISLNYSVLEVIADTNASYKLISEGSAQSKIKKGQGNLNRYLIDAEEAVANPSLISVGKGKTYFYNDQKTEFLQPIYVFEADAVTGNQAEKAEIYLPALKDTYFSK